MRLSSFDVRRGVTGFGCVIGCGAGQHGWIGGRRSSRTTVVVVEAENVPNGPAKERPGAIDEAEHVHTRVFKKAGGDRR